MTLGPVQAFAYWQHGASARAQGKGIEVNPYPPESLPGRVWLAGWQAWDDYLHQSGAMAGPRFRYGVLWWGGRFWNWQERWFVAAVERPLLVAGYKFPPHVESKADVLRGLMAEHLPGSNLDSIAVLRTPEGG